MHEYWEHFICEREKFLVFLPAALEGRKVVKVCLG